MRQTRTSWTMAVALMASSGALAAEWEGLRLAREGAEGGKRRMSIVAPGRYKAAFETSNADPKRWGEGLAGLYDLINDPEERYNYTAPYPPPPDGGGVLCKIWGINFRLPGSREPLMLTDGKPAASVYAASGSLEVIEANPVRVVIKRTGECRRYGRLDLLAVDGVQMETTLAFYAPDRIYHRLAIVGTGRELEVTTMEVVLHASHHRYTRGKTVRVDGWDKYTIAAPWTFAPEDPGDGRGKTFVLLTPKPAPLDHGDGTQSRHRAGFLMALHKERGRYGYSGSEFIGIRGSIHTENSVPDRVIAKGKRIELCAVVHMNHELASLQAAAPYVKQYREPGVPKCSKGGVVGDGFDEALGCYTLKADGNAADFEVPVNCHWPVFQIEDWSAAAPARLAVDGKDVAHGDQWLACVEKGRLLVQLAGPCRGGTRIRIGGDR